MNTPTPPQATNALTALALATLLTLGFDLQGLLVALLTTTALALLPTTYAFALGTAAIATLTPPQATTPQVQLPPLLLVAIALLVLALWSEFTTPQDRPTLPVLLAVTLALAVIAVLGVRETESLWLTGSLLLGVLVTTAYALHRYTTVFILEEPAQ